MFGVFSGEFGSNFWVTFFPECGEVARDLNRALAGSEDLNHQRNAVVGDAQFSLHAEEVLDTDRDGWAVGTAVLDFELSSIGHFQPFGEELFHRVVLGWR